MRLKPRHFLTTIFSVIISGCVIAPQTEPKEKIVQKTVYLPIQLELPSKPDVPKIKGSDLKCLSENTRSQLLERDKIIKGYISDLETTIISTQKK